MINGIFNKEINFSSFKVKDKLNPKFWPNGKLNSRVRLKLMDITDDFINELSINWVKPIDVILTGSIANYNWSRYSDVDIHILIDFKQVYSKSSEFVDDYFKAKKENWLSEHNNLKIYGYPIEISVEDSNVKNNSSGRYSLYKNKWIVEPNDFQDVDLNKDYIKNRAVSIMSQIDDIEKSMKTETDTYKYEEYGNKAQRIFDKLKKMRTEGLASTKKEMSSGNIIYKIIRRSGYLDKIWDIINSSYDKANSINESYQYGNANNISAGIIPFRMNKDGKTEVFLGFPGQPKVKDFNPPMWMNRWQILKGHMEGDEDPKHVAVREFSEESGINPKLLSSHKLFELGSERISNSRTLVCYGIDLTDNKDFDSFNFHSNLIDDPKYIQINGGKAYPEIEHYAWKTLDGIGSQAPYETEFYNRCNKLCNKLHPQNKTIKLTDKQVKEIQENFKQNSII